MLSLLYFTGMNNTLKNLSEKDSQSLKYFSKRLKQSLPNQVAKLRLYGSKARGEAHRYSDTDVLIVLKCASQRNKNRVYDAKAETVQKYGAVLSAHIMSQKEYAYEKKLPSLFMQFIEREAIDF